MKLNRSCLSSLLVISAVVTPALFAQASPTSDLAEVVNPAPVSASFSSSAPTPDLAPAAKAADANSGGALPAGEVATKPFSAVGVDVKIGVGGIGFDVATPLARKFNLRGTGYFFRYNTSITENYVTYGGNIQLASGGVNLDWYPFGGKFRLTGGLVFYNANELSGSATVNPNQSFTINGNTYYSSSTDPIHASATLNIGRKVAPGFAFGWGNIVPRKANKHISVPVEFGFIYVGQPTIDLGFVGSTCNALGTACQSVANNPTFQSDLAAQKAKFQNDLSALSFYPVASIGFGYKF